MYMFNVLGNLQGLLFKMAYGSGAVAVEAIRRGAKHVMAMNLDLDAYKCAAGNVASMGLQSSITVLRKNVNHGVTAT